jgi:hypothetical protein
MQRNREIACRLCAALVGAVLALPLVSCALGEAPSAPSPTSAAAPVLFASNGTWTLTVVGVSANGASSCLNAPPAVAGPYTFPIAVGRTAATVGFVWGVFTDDVDFEGSIAGEVFTATANEGVTQGSCGRSEISTLTGSFSADERHLTAQETDVYHWPDGDVTYTSNWTADHQ